MKVSSDMFDQVNCPETSDAMQSCYDILQITRHCHQVHTFTISNGPLGFGGKHLPFTWHSYSPPVAELTSSVSW